MSIYAQDHAGALADVTEAGGAVTFSKTARTITASTGVSTTAPVSVAGSAIEIEGDPKVYETLRSEGGLGVLELTTLLFTGSTFGEIPALGSTCTWAGSERTVRWTRPLRPDGTAILSYVVVSL